MVDETKLFDQLNNNLQNYSQVIVIGPQHQRDYYINVLPFIINSKFNFYRDNFKKLKDRVYLIDKYSDPTQLIDHSSIDSTHFYILNEDGSLEKQESAVIIDAIPTTDHTFTLNSGRGDFSIDIKDIGIIARELAIGKIYTKLTRDIEIQIRKIVTKFTDKDAKKLVTYFAFFILDEYATTHQIIKMYGDAYNKLRRYLSFQNLDQHTETIFKVFASSLEKGLKDFSSTSISSIEIDKTSFSFDSRGNLTLRLDEKYSIRNGDSYPMMINEFVIASCIRYHYMDLGTIGLATMYKSMGYNPNDSVLEAFSSILNRYFDNYCSAFEDVDITSKGNFFNLSIVNQKIMVVNPPFEISIMSDAFKKCRELCEKNKELTCHFIIPDWKDWPELDQLEKDSFKVLRFKKEEKTFIDYEGRKEIHPCPVVYLFYGKQRQVDNITGKIIVDEENEEEKKEDVNTDIDLFEMLRFEKLLYKF